MSLSRIERLECDIDCRLHDLWRELDEHGDTLNVEQVAAFMRAAFGAGYAEALSEPVPGSLCRDHGYAVPTRRAA